MKSLKTIEKKIKEAFTVIIDGVLLTNSSPKESYQKKYDKVNEIDESLIADLYTYYSNHSCEDKKLAHDLLVLAQNIKIFADSHQSFLCDKIEPERWMFKFQ